MKKGSKALLISLCVLLALGLICIGAGVVVGGDFGAVLEGIGADLSARLSGS